MTISQFLHIQGQTQKTGPESSEIKENTVTDGVGFLDVMGADTKAVSRALTVSDITDDEISSHQTDDDDENDFDAENTIITDEHGVRETENVDENSDQLNTKPEHPEGVQIAPFALSLKEKNNPQPLSVLDLGNKPHQIVTKSIHAASLSESAGFQALHPQDKKNKILNDKLSENVVPKVEKQGALLNITNARTPIEASNAETGVPKTSDILHAKTRENPSSNPAHPNLSATLPPRDMAITQPSAPTAISAITQPFVNQMAMQFLEQSALLQGTPIPQLQAETTLRGVAPLPSFQASDTATARHIAQQMLVTITSNEAGQSEIRLDPKELGRLRMQIFVNENTLSMTILTERPETTDLMRRHVDTLMAEFQDLGYDSLSFSFGNEDGNSQEERGSDHPDQTLGDGTPIAETRSHTLLSSDNRLDLRL